MNEFKDLLDSQKEKLGEEEPLFAEDISNLYYKKYHKATEEDFKKVLRRYNLREGLITLGRMSFFIFRSEDKNIFGQIFYREPSTGIIVSQFILAYLANILIISGTNDYKIRYISQLDNLLALCSSYIKSLEEPSLVDKNSVRSFMIRKIFEQGALKFVPVHMIARTFIIFNELIQVIKPDKFDVLSDIFEKETGLTIYDYLVLCFIIYTGAMRTATFRINMITDANFPELKDILTEEKIVNFLNILKADYEKFIEVDVSKNKDLESLFTKTRFNPLLVYPIIETDVKDAGDPYVIPNIMAYIKRAYGGLYWWFQGYFENLGQQLDFRTYFGDLFQKYVGRILIGIYGEENVHPERTYGKKKVKFIDWWVERGEKIYLFEVKAYQFALLSRQTGDVIDNEIRKIGDAIEQVFKRVQDIPKYEELKLFRTKEIIPFIIFMDMPFISTNLYIDRIKEELREIEQREQISGLENFKVFLMNVEDIELYDDVVDDIELEDVFQRLTGDVSESFISIIWKIKGEDLHNRYLDNIFKNFMRMGFGRLVERNERE